MRCQMVTRLTPKRAAAWDWLPPACRKALIREVFSSEAGMVPVSRGLRQVVRWEEQRPSRRHKAPICPESVQASTSLRIRSLYSAVNRRRRGFANTSGVGQQVAWAFRPSWSLPPAGATHFCLPGFCPIRLSPPSTNLPWGECLSYIDTEGFRQWVNGGAAAPPVCHLTKTILRLTI